MPLTPALKAMVEAMRDEFTAQVRHYETARVHERANPYSRGRAALDELAGGFDIEKVARAGLEAAERHSAGASIDLGFLRSCAAELSDPTSASGDNRLGIELARLLDAFAFSAILKEQP